ncbi:Hydroxypyruvate isomerase [compost metagenome]
MYCEAINPLDMPGFLVNTPEDLLGLLDAVAHPNLFAQLDLYHMARQGLDLPTAIRALAGRIGHVQFADCPGRGAPGSGALDFTAALQALREAGYDDWLAAEYRPDAAGTEAGLGWLSRWRP